MLLSHLINTDEVATLKDDLMKTKLCMTCLRYLIILNGIEMLIHVCSLLCGTDSSWGLWMLLSQCALVLLAVSYALKFCLLHRLFIVYSHLVVACVIFQKYHGFGTMLTPARLFMMTTGIVMIVLLIRKEIRIWKAG